MVARSHPTLRPHALALGVLAPALSNAALASVVPVDRLFEAFWKDTLKGLVTFPLRSRVFLVRTEEEAARIGPSLPAGWRAVAHPAATGAPGSISYTELHGALETLLLPGIEAGLVVCADTPSLPIGEIFDALLWMAQTARAGLRRVTLGLTPENDPTQSPGLYAAGSAQVEPALFAKGGAGGLAAFEAQAAEEKVEVRALSRRARVINRASLDALTPELLAQGTTDAGKLLRQLRGQPG